MAQLTAFLDQLHSRYHRAEFLSSDPLEFVHRHSDPRDQEAVALVSALLAYGNVKQIRRSVQDALDRMESVAESPQAFVRSLSRPDGLLQARKAFNGFVHRFNRGADLVLLFTLLERSWREYGSLGAHFGRFMKPEDKDFGSALSLLIAEWRSWAGKRVGTSFSYLLTSPKDGSCCKRWCMFLRWMGRKDDLDVGLWAKYVRADQLVIPLDTHTGRISQYLGLTDRKTLDWKAAIAVTNGLRVADKDDPTRYDFAMARLGILDLCQRKYRREICEQCPLLPACRFAAAGKRRLGAAH